MFFQIEGGSPGTTAILFTLSVYLVESPRYRRRSGRSPRSRLLWPDALSSAENGSSAASLELTATLLRTGTLSSDAHAHKVQFLTPAAATPWTAGVAAAAAAAANAAATSAARTPKAPASGAGQSSFEAAMTRLAGAAELGTEALIYVRRADVAEIVDVLMDHARSPVGPTVSSPALARLTLVRRSRRRDLPSGSGRRVCSPVPRGTRPLSGFRRLGSPSPLVDGPRGVGGGGGSVRRFASASPTSRTTSGGRALFQDSVMTPPLRDVTRTNSSSTRVTFRARSPAESPSGDNARNGNGGGGGSAGARRVRGSQDGKQGRLRQRVRSPSPPASAAIPACSSACVVGMTPIALTKNSEAPLASSAGGVPSGEDKRKPAAPVPLAMKAGENAAAASAAFATPATAGKIRYTPLQPTAGEPVKGDFSDFWDVGYG